MASKRLVEAQGHIARVTGYLIEDLNLVRQALDTTGLYTPQSNQRLALVGDAALRSVIVNEWYPTGAQKRVAADLVEARAGNSALERVGRATGLEEYVAMHPGHYGPVPHTPLETTIEAIIGAIYLASGKDLSVVRTAMLGLGLIPDDAAA